MASDSTAEISPPQVGVATTPSELAAAAVTAAHDANGGLWLDPCAGSGPLVTAMIDAGVQRKNILAIDIASNQHQLRNLGVPTMLGVDFIAWSQGTKRRFDRIVANPPYVSLRTLHPSLLKPARRTQFFGGKVPLTSNYWAVFLAACLRLLNPGGTLACILPAAWEYADYARPLREYCAMSFRTMVVHRTSAPMFDEVSDGCVLLVGKGHLERPMHAPLVLRHKTLDELVQHVKNRCPRHDFTETFRESAPGIPDNAVRFGDIAEVRIGAVTGDAGYFLLTESQRLNRRIPLSAVRPILSKAHHLTASEINCDAWESLVNSDHRVWLFSPDGDALTHQDVRSYLSLERSNGGCSRTAYHVAKRHPWYKVSIPDKFHGFLTGMAPSIPWVALNGMNGLTATNTLYGIRFLATECIDEHAAWCLSMLSSLTMSARFSLGRRYPQGLTKLEPADFAALPVHTPQSTSNARSLYRRAVQLIRGGRREVVQRFVDDWVGGSA